MFRISKRSAERFKHIQEFKGTTNGSIALALDDIRLIEQTHVFSLGEKIELLQVALGNKLTTEIYMKISLNLSNQKDLMI